MAVENLQTLGHNIAMLDKFRERIVLELQKPDAPDEAFIQAQTMSTVVDTYLELARDRTIASMSQAKHDKLLPNDWGNPPQEELATSDSPTT